MTRVRLFAAAAEAAGAEELTGAFDSLAELERELDARFGPEFARVRSQCSFMVDGVRAEGDAALGAEATVDVLPPFAGG
jgi:molybdopterin converting factor small subunit